MPFPASISIGVTKALQRFYARHTALKQLPPRYLVIHQAACGCQNRAPYTCANPGDVALYLWGRDVARHVVYDGECPYHFATGDLEAISATLDWYEAGYVRRVLPLIVPLSVLWNLGYCQGRGDPESVVCVIGDQKEKRV